ncbi:MAG: matrixin [Myxococcaceae bacterium]|nr:matrixin [Myxococcaceae bacterium]
MIAVVLLSLVSSQAYARSRAAEGDPKTQCLWWKERSVITWQQARQGNAATPGDDEFGAVASSFSTWQDVLTGCGSLTLQQGPRSDSRRAEYLGNGRDENLVVFRERACASVAPRQDPCFSDGSCGNAYDCWQFGELALGITTTSFDPRTGRILDADVELNAHRWLFTTVDAPPCPVGAPMTDCVATDVQNTVTHEVGHLLGLAHVDALNSTMAPRAAPGETSKRVIDPGSRRFICDVYAAGRPSLTCFTLALGTESGPAVKQSCTSAPGGALLALALTLAWRRRR